MTTQTLRSRAALTFVLLLFAAGLALLARPRSPLPPYPEMDLRSWRFDQTNAVDAEHLGAISANSVALVESWSGYAWDVTAPTSPLVLPVVREKGRLNLAPGLGSVRLWFAPAWSSETLSGGGPGTWATLLELNQSNRTAFTLALAIDPTGDSLQVLVGTGKSWTPWLQAEIAWAAGQWHQVALLYSAEGVALMVDADVVASTDQPLPWPEQKVWNRSVFSLGTALDGRQPARGWLDEIFTFAYAPHPDYVAMRYYQAAAVAAMGPMSEEEWALRRTPSALRVSSGENTLYSSSLPGPPPCEGCPTNVPVAPPPVPGFSITNGLRFAPAPYLTNNGSGYVTWLLGTNSGERYEIYQTTNLVGTSVWASTWSLLATGGVSFTFAHPTNDGAKAFYLAATYVDADGDGLSDAYESLVLRTTNLWDFDSDGMPDFWEMAHGLSYTNRNDATNDFDGDGIKNLAEYQYEAALINPVEPLGPSSRRTPLVISEIMYNPAPGGTEFIEIYNTHHLPQKLDGFTLGLPNDPARFYTFTNTTLAPGSFIAVVPTNSLGGSEALQFRNSRGAVLLEVNYSDKTPWPKAADGTGHSLVLSRPSYGENDVRAWSVSARVGGSRGTAESVVQDFKAAIRINEFLAFPVSPSREFIELHNTSSVTQDISGWYLSCLAANLAEYTFPPGTVLPPRGFHHLFGSTTNSAPDLFPFLLSNGGDSIFLTTTDTNRVVDAVNFDAQEAGVSTGRSPDGGPVFRQLAAPTTGGTNAPALVRNIVISEIMYHPASGSNAFEYVELHNRGSTNQSLAGWSISGIGFANFGSLVLQPTSNVVVALSANSLMSAYPGRFTVGVNLVGNYVDDLANGGQRLALKNTFGVVIDEVCFGDGGRWGRWSDGTGSSLELIDTRADHRLAANWADSLASTSAPWTSLSVTGIVQNGDGTNFPNGLELMMLGEGECLVDDVQVIATGGTNLISNGTFNGACLQLLVGDVPSMCGTNVSMTTSTCWYAQGTHEMSEVLTNGGTTNGPCLWIRATERGDYAANRIATCWGTAISTGVTCVIRANVKWLRGHPELVLRLRGSYLEAVAHMMVAPGGTPGSANSQRLANAPPAIHAVTHYPVVPAANEAVLVTARVHDPDGVANLVLRYRLDAATNYTNIVMRDDGTAGDALMGDGIFTGKVPAQSSGTVVAFTVEATDGFGATSRFPKAEKLFPTDALQRECVIHFGDGQPTGNFGTYRVWMTTATFNQWTNRVKWHNSPLDVTFVYSPSRVIYNAGAKYAGTIYTSSKYYNTPTGNLCSYSLDFSSDDRLLGASGGTLDFDRSEPQHLQSEQLAMTLADQLELPNNYRRFIHLYVRGVKRAANVAYEDSQQPNGDFLSQWFPGDDEGQLFKLELWFYVTGFPLPTSIGQAQATLDRFNRAWPGGMTNLDLAHYRLNWLPRAVKNSADDYSVFSNLVAAAATAGTASYFTNMTNQIDPEQWMRVFGFERAVNNLDSYGFNNGHNMYAYHTLLPGGGGRKWNLLMIDFDGVFQYSNGTNDPYTLDPFRNPGNMTTAEFNLLAHAPFRRAAWRCLYDLANPTNGLMLAANINPIFDANHAALLANGYTPPDPSSTNADKYTIVHQQTNLWARLASVRPAFSILGPTNGASTTSSTVTLNGLAPVEIMDLKLGTNPTAVTWSTVTNWSFIAPLSLGTNNLQVNGHDRKGNLLVSSNVVVIRN